MLTAHGRTGPASRWLAALAALTVVVGACSGTVASPSPTVAPSATTGATAPPATPVAYTLTFWTDNQSMIPGMEAAAKAFNEKTGNQVTVDSEFYTDTDGVYEAKIAQAARDGGLPDIFADAGGKYYHAKDGLYTELTAQFDDPWKAELIPGAADIIPISALDVEACAKTSDCSKIAAGQVYTFPFLTGASEFVFARKSLLEAAGLDPNTPPTSWEAWIADVQVAVARDKNVGGVTTGLKGGGGINAWIFAPFLHGYLGDAKWVDLFENGTAESWGAPDVVAAVEAFDQLSPLWTSQELTADTAQDATLFGAGGATWIIGGTFSLPGILAAGVPQEDILAFPLPMSTAGVQKQLKTKSFYAYWTGVSRDAKDPELVKEFWRFLLSKEGASAYAPATAGDPSVVAGVSIGSDTLVDAVTSAMSGDADAYDEVGGLYPRIGGCEASGGSVNTPIQAALTKLYTGEGGPAEVAREIGSLIGSARAACG